MKRAFSFSVLAMLATPGCGAGDPLDTSERVGESAAAFTTAAELLHDPSLDGTGSHHDEICDLDVDWLNDQLDLNLVAGNQIRIRRSGGTADQKGACTIRDRDGAGDQVRMGDLGFQRIEVDVPADDATETPIVLDSAVTNAAYGIGDESAAQSAQELFDDVKETSSAQTDVVALAPHGGQMELRTDTQANNHFYNRLLAGKVTSWQANGYNDSSDGINASEHWHITATDLRPAGFQHLAGVTARRFKYPVAFHGYTSTRNGQPFHQNEVLVGGRESALFRQEIAETITLATRNPTTLVPVITGVFQSLPGDLDGGGTQNIVNWIGTTGKGLQLEQSSEARGLNGATDFSAEIAKAVGTVYRCLVDAPRHTINAATVGHGQGFITTPSGNCDRLIVDVTVPSSELSSFALSGIVHGIDMASLTQAQCEAFEGYVSIYKEVSSRWERQHGGHLDASWTGSSCKLSQIPGAYTVAPPSSGTARYRITVRAAHGATLSTMTAMRVEGLVKRVQ